MPGKEGLLKTFLQTSGGSQMLSATLALLGRTFSANLALIGAEHWKILVLYPAVWHYRSARVSQATLCCIRPSIFQFSLCPGCTCPILFCFICKEWIQEEKNILPTPFFHSIFCLVWSFSSFSLGFTEAWPILPPSKMRWKGAICGFPLLIYFQKTL